MMLKILTAQIREEIFYLRDLLFKKEEEDFLALTHQYNDSRTTEKHEGQLITATRNDTDNTKANRMSTTRK